MTKLPRVIPILVVTALLACSSARAQTFIDDFNDGDDGGWTRIDPISAATGGASSSTFSFPGGNRYRIQGVASPNLALVGPARAGATRLDNTHFDFEVAVDIVDWDNSLPQGFGVVARAGDFGLGSTRGYLLTNFFIGQSNTRRIAINRIENEMVVQPESGAVSDSFFADIVLDPANDYRMVFTGIGPALTGQLFDLADLTNPLLTLTAEDSTYASGSPGLLAAAIPQAVTPFPTDVTFDNFRAVNIPEPASLVLLAVTAAGLLLVQKHGVLPSNRTL